MERIKNYTNILLHLQPLIDEYVVMAKLLDGSPYEKMFNDLANRTLRPGEYITTLKDVNLQFTDAAITREKYYLDRLLTYYTPQQRNEYQEIEELYDLHILL
jgi:hypothetical protein